MKKYIYVLFGMLMMMQVGIIYTWTIISVQIRAEFPAWSSAGAAMCFTICLTSFCLGGFFNAWLLNRFKLFWGIGLSAILYCGGIGLLLLARTSPILIYLGFGVMIGSAAGMIYNIIMSNVAPWFPRRMGLISGLLLMSLGIGSFLLGKIYQGLISSGAFTWRGVFELYGFIVLVCFMLGVAILRRPPKSTIDDSQRQGAERRSYTSREMLRSRMFWLIFIWGIAVAGTGAVLMAHANGILHEVAPAVSASLAATLVGLVSIFNGLGRALYGYLYDLLGYRKGMALIEILLLICVAALLIALNQGSLIFTVIGFISGGLFYAGVAANSPPMINEFFGKKYYALNYAIMNLCAIAASFGSTIAGGLYDATASYLPVIKLLMLAGILSCVVFFFIKRPE